MSDDVQNNEISLSESEVEQLNEVFQLSTQIQSAFGNLKIRKIQLEAEEDNLKQQFVQKSQKEIEISQKINQKYGTGSVDLQRGVFIKAE
tara:strand:+ start:407 stop:676 length:270 start_codon:yes stop_codon:yes gene_type:complete